MKKILIIIILMIFILGCIPNAYAENVNFNKNFLITNLDFTDFNSMSLKEIDNFLREHGSVLPRYKENGETAAQIIFSASQKYKINPKVIITTIQKEEGLITKTRYNKYALDFAMGCRKPSTFMNQVNNGTKLLRDAFDFMAEKYGWKVGNPHKTLDNPKYIDNTVTPKNKATAALYLYTPYIGGYYKDNGVYIGGNYNFVKIYTRWFGKVKKFSSEFASRKITFFVPQGKVSIIPITVTNNGDAQWEKDFSLTAIFSQPESDINPVEIGQNIGRGKSATLYVQIPPSEKNLNIHMQLFTNSGKAFGEIEDIQVVPVKIVASAKIEGQNLEISVANGIIDIPYFTLQEELGNNGNIIWKKIVSCKLTKNDPLKDTIKIPDYINSFQVILRGIGSSEPLHMNSNILTAFFTKSYSNGKVILTLNTIPPGASLSIDSKSTNLTTPLSIPVTIGNHHILIKKEGFKNIEKDIKIDKDTQINLNLERIDIVPPKLSISNVPSYTPNLFIKLHIKASNAANLYINNEKQKQTNCTKFIKLKIGKNIINIMAEDEVGNKTAKNVIIVYSPLPPSKLQLFIEKKYLYINSIKKAIDTAPIIKNGRTLLPVRAIIESLGGKISWNKTNEEVTILINGVEIHLFIGKNKGTVNGKEVPIDKNEGVHPLIIHSRTYLPLRFIVENIGGSIEWNAKEKEITIIYPYLKSSSENASTWYVKTLSPSILKQLLLNPALRQRCVKNALLSGNSFHTCGKKVA